MEHEKRGSGGPIEEADRLSVRWGVQLGTVSREP